MRHRRTALGLLAVLVIASAACATHKDFRVPDVAVGDRQFDRLLAVHADAPVAEGNEARLLLNGDEIFPAMLDAIRQARRTLTFANFLYATGPIAEELASAFAERCRAGVEVKILLDDRGSSKMPKRLKEQMREAGCRVETFAAISAFTLRDTNNRNHRRILVADGRVGFTGGTGVGDQWTGDGRLPGHWRQTDVRVRGPVVRGLQLAFAESWRETTGELLGGDAYFPDLDRAGTVKGQAVRSSPVGGAAEAYLLFLLAIEGARSSIFITSPYFLPDDQMMGALERAVARGVRVSVLTAGETDTLLDRVVRTASRARFGRALKAGIRIWEYRPALLHSKTIAVDGRWATVGSANLDRRSFAINHELNLAFHDPELARQLERIFADDVQHAQEMTREAWQKRNLIGRLFEPLTFPVRDQL